MVSSKPSRGAALVAAAVVATVLTAGPTAAQAPAADIYVPAGIGVDIWRGVQTLPVAVNVVNFGDAPAADVALTLEVPPGWTADVPVDPDPPDRTCTAAPDGSSVTCTYDEMEPGGSVRSYFAEVTSPAGPSSPGIATVTATTSTPELDEFPNSTSDTLRHAGMVDVTVTPSTGLVDGDPAQVQVAGFLPSTTVGSAICDDTAPLALANCDLRTVSYSNSDAAGHATFTRTMARFIVTASGVHDCAFDACTLGVADLSLVTLGSAPVSFSPTTPPSNLGIGLGAAPYLSTDPTGAATVPAVLTCTTAASVRVELTISQLSPGGTRTTRTSTIVSIPCTPGTPVPITSDLTGDSFAPGAAEVLVHTTAPATGSTHATIAGDVDIQSFSEVVTALAARLADPSDTTALPELVAAFTFRLRHNPVFARAFWAAVLAPPAP